MQRPIPALALALLFAIAVASPVSATIGARWSWPVTSWQPNLVPRDAASTQMDLVNLRPDVGPHPAARIEWIRPEDGIVRASTSTSHLDASAVMLGAISLAHGPSVPDVFTWLATGGANDELSCYTAPGPGGPGPGFLDRPAAWRILVPSSQGAMPPIYFANVENGTDLEIVIQAPKDNVRVYDRNGVLLQSINLSTQVGGDRFTDYVVSLADVEGDGRSEMFVTYPAPSGVGLVVGLLGSTAPTSAPSALPPYAPSLAPLAPNPMRAGSLVSWTLPRPGPASVRVFDAAGRNVRTLIEGVAPAGTYSRAWDGRDDDGHRLAPGVYMVEVAAAGQRQARKAVVLR